MLKTFIIIFRASNENPHTHKKLYELCIAKQCMELNIIMLQGFLIFSLSLARSYRNKTIIKSLFEYFFVALWHINKLGFILFFPFAERTKKNFHNNFSPATFYNMMIWNFFSLFPFRIDKWNYLLMRYFFFFLFRTKSLFTALWCW